MTQESSDSPVAVIFSGPGTDVRLSKTVKMRRAVELGDLTPDTVVHIEEAGVLTGPMAARDVPLLLGLFVDAGFFIPSQLSKSDLPVADATDAAAPPEAEPQLSAGAAALALGAPQPSAHPTTASPVAPDSRWARGSAIGFIGVGGAIALVVGLVILARAGQGLDQRPQRPKPVEKPTAVAAATVLTGVPEVIDTATLNVNGKTVALDGVVGEKGALIGNMILYIQEQGDAVRCTPARGGKYRCAVAAGPDIGEVVLANGAARAAVDASPLYLTRQAEAKAARRGVWR